MEQKMLMLIASRLEERRSQILDATAGGSAKDFAEYRYMCGTIRGLETALSEINDLLRKFKEIEDE